MSTETAPLRVVIADDSVLLRAVVQVANHALALLVGRRHDPRP